MPEICEKNYLSIASFLLRRPLSVSSSTTSAAAPLPPSPPPARPAAARRTLLHAAAAAAATGSHSARVRGRIRREAAQVRVVVWVGRSDSGPIIAYFSISMHFFQIFRVAIFSPSVSQEHLRKTARLNLPSYFLAHFLTRAATRSPSTTRRPPLRRRHHRIRLAKTVWPKRTRTRMPRPIWPR